LYRVLKKGELTEYNNNIILTPQIDSSQNDGIVSVIEYCTNLEDIIVYVNKKHQLRTDNIHNWIAQDPRFYIIKQFDNWNWISIYDSIKQNDILTQYREILEKDNKRLIVEINIKNIDFLRELNIADPFQALNYGGTYEGRSYEECGKYSHYSLHEMITMLFNLEEKHLYYQI
jgi:hypothetical protein